MEIINILLFIIAIVIIGLIFKRINSSLNSINDQVKSQIISTECKQVVTYQPDVFRKKKYESAIERLNFEEALSLEAFYKEMYTSSLTNFQEDILDNLGLREIIQSYPITYSTKKLIDGSIVFALTENGNKLLSNGKAELIFESKSGKILPAIRDSKTKEFIEQFKGKSPDIASKIGNLTNVVINIAHIISGADLAKQLKSVNKKLDYLLACRRIDQFSRLEANYNIAREIISSKLDEVDKSEIRRLHQENMELRYVWRQEIEARMSEIDNPENYNWLKKKLTRQKTINKKISCGLSELENELNLIDFSVTYDIALTSVFDDEQEYFFHKTLRQEINNLSKLSKMFSEKANNIKDENGASISISVVTYINEMSKKYEGFIPSKLISNIEEAVISESFRG